MSNIDSIKEVEERNAYDDGVRDTLKSLSKTLLIALGIVIIFSVLLLLI